MAIIKKWGTARLIHGEGKYYRGNWSNIKDNYVSADSAKLELEKFIEICKEKSLLYKDFSLFKAEEKIDELIDILEEYAIIQLVKKTTSNTEHSE